MSFCNTLLANLRRGEIERCSERKISGVNAIYKVEGDSDVLYFWNSSNNQKIFDKRDLLDEIYEQVKDGYSEGSVDDNMNEFLFEVEEI